MTTDNLKLWNKVSKTNPAHTKEVNFGRKFNAIDAHSQVMAATEVLGPCGIGWGIRNSQYQMLVVDQQDTHYNLLQFTAELWYVLDGKEGAIDIAADIELFTETKRGWQRVEDSHKKVRTDAVTKGLSWLGFNADVFLGLYEDNKYVQAMKQEFSGKKDQVIAPVKEQDTDLSRLAKADKVVMALAEEMKAAGIVEITIQAILQKHMPNELAKRYLSGVVTAEELQTVGIDAFTKLHKDLNQTLKNIKTKG